MTHNLSTPDSRTAVLHGQGGPDLGAPAGAAIGAPVRSEEPTRASRQRPVRILIVGGDSDFNLGDRAILSALCGCLSANDRPVALTVTSKMDTLARFPGVVRTLHRGARGFAALLHSAAQQDLVLIGGGGLFQDDDSRSKMPYWSLRVAALRAVNRRIAAHCIGAGPLRHSESRLSARLACAMLESITVRDEFARDWLGRCTSRQLDVVPDPAFMLRPAPRAAADRLLKQLGLQPGRPIIGVALRRWFHRLGGFVPHSLRSSLGIAGGQDRNAMDQLLEQLASTLRRLAGRLDASILLLPTYNTHCEADDEVCNRLAMRLHGTRATCAALADPSLYKAVMGRLTLMISARMHPLILAAGMGVPIVGLAYNGKFHGLFQLLGLPERLLWLDQLGTAGEGATLEAMALSAIEDPTDLRARAEQLADRSRQRTAMLVLKAAAGGWASR